MGKIARPLEHNSCLEVDRRLVKKCANIKSVKMWKRLICLSFRNWRKKWCWSDVFSSEMKDRIFGKFDSAGVIFDEFSLTFLAPMESPKSASFGR